MKQSPGTGHTKLEPGLGGRRSVSCHRFSSPPIPCAPWFLLLLLTAVASTVEFRVGFAQADITPPVGWRRGGNYTELISTGINDPLLTKSMVVQDGPTTFAFVGNDLCSVPRDLTDLAREKASQLTGMPVANIVITATHTHGGPEYLGPLRQFLHGRALKANSGRDPHEPIDYRAQLVERWAGVIAAAWSNRQPATLEVVIPRLEGVAHNRRYWMKDGSVGWNPRKGDTNIFRPAGPVDTDFPFLLARRLRHAHGGLWRPVVWRGFPWPLADESRRRLRAEVRLNLRRRLCRRREPSEPVHLRPAALDQRIAQDRTCDGAGGVDESALLQQGEAGLICGALRHDSHARRAPQ